MVVPYIYQILRTYAPVITLPIAIVVGAIGYTLESMVREDRTPSFERTYLMAYHLVETFWVICYLLFPSIEEKRRKRQEELGKVLISPDPIPDPSKIVPKTILDRNLPPSLQPGTK